MYNYGGNSGAADRTRTYDPIITNDVLYQLSYSGTLTGVRTPSGGATYTPKYPDLKPQIIRIRGFPDCAPGRRS